MKKRGLLKFLFLVYFSLLAFPFTVQAQTGEWNTISNTGVIHRHENSFVEVNGKFYLIGGRRLGLEKYTNIYDPASGTWSTGIQKSPIELHHFQAVTYNGLIYIIGAFTGGHPNETPVDKVYIYSPTNDTWSTSHDIPEGRRRGAAGAVVYNNKIYIVGGAVNGHKGDNVTWLDEYNPSTGEWKTLSDAPRARDHFQAVVSGSKLFLAGGRRSKIVFDPVLNKDVNKDEYVHEVDVYNFNTGSWDTSYPHISVVRAGTASVEFNGEVLVIGGESPASGSRGYAHTETAALHVENKTWRDLAPLNTGRHATHALVFNNKVYIASGSKSNGGSGSSELVSMEEFSFSASNPNELSFPTEIVFDQVEQNESDTKTVTLLNENGNDDITIQSIYLENNVENSFAINSGPAFPYLLEAGSSVTFEILFEPVSSGEKTADIKIEHSGENSPSTISLQGEGIFDVTAVNDAYFSSVSIYPNPTRKELSIKNLPEVFNWEINNLSGKKLIGGKTIPYTQDHTIDISSLPPGMYILTLKNDRNHKSFMIKKD